jgi:hypothetical protein
MGPNGSIGLAVAAATCLVLAGCAVLQPSIPPATQTPGPATATPVPVMGAHGLAQVVAPSGAQSWAKPGGRGKKLDLLTTGTIVYLMQRATAKDGSAWWATPVSGHPFSGPTPGWVPERPRDGSPALEPVNPDCPGTAPRAAVELPPDPWFRLACYGSRELELEGTVRCNRTSGDAGVQGAPWQAAYSSCVLDGVLGLNGNPVTTLLSDDDPAKASGVHVVRGHFDDPGSEHCVGTGHGVTIGPNSGPGQPAAILLCRSYFVVDEVLPPTGG